MPANKTAPSSREKQTEAQIGRRELLVLSSGVFLITFSLLALQISVSRLLSVALQYHFVFVILSLAFLGMGLGGIFVHLFRRKIGVASGRRGFSTLALFAGLFALSIPFSVMGITRIVYIGNTEARLLLLGLLLFLPFFIAGMLLAQIFRAYSQISSKVYGADLIGAACGSLGVIIMLNFLGGIDTIFLVGLVAAVAAVLFALEAAWKNLRQAIFPLLTLLAIAGLLGTNITGASTIDMPIGMDQSKEIYSAIRQSTYGGEITETRWSAFGRTDLVSFRTTPEAKAIFIDGSAGTPMYQFGGDIQNPDDIVAKLRTDFAGYLGLAFLQDGDKDNILIIGPGGGRDVLLALMVDVRKITAVEVNRNLVEIVRDYSDYNGGIFTDFENVSVVVDEGRSFLKRQKETYDIIMLSLPVLSSSRSLEGLALTENFLFTTGSIDDYLEHLTDDGRLVVVGHNLENMMKLLSTSLEALQRKGVDNRTAMKQVFIVGKPAYPVFVLKKTPFEQEEMIAVHQSLHELDYDPTLSWLPAIKEGKCPVHDEGIGFDQCNMFSPVFVALANGWADIAEVRHDLGKYGMDLRAPTDDSPFFFKSGSGMPKPISLVLWPSAALLIVMVSANVIYYRRKSAPLDKGRSRRNSFPINDLYRFAALFLMLGTGFMLAEISAFQRLTLFLGQPVLALAVLLFSLLAGTGVGSLRSGRISLEKTPWTLAVMAGSVSALLVLFALFQPLLTERLLGVALPVRILVTVCMMGILGFFMGFPFPLGLRLLKGKGMEEHIPWMWGINGIASVFGSVMAIILAMSLGFTAALVVGAACYFAVFLIFRAPAGQKQLLKQ
ncbi:MAG: hypothetical protein HYX84_09280 [Chloroflexi bacterium]|nr:hypothetical protein [Chloroflexota bacterium]